MLTKERSSTSVPISAEKGVSGRGVKGDIGMSSFKDCFASGVEGISGRVFWIIDVRHIGGSRVLVSFVDVVSSVIFGKSNTSTGFKVLPDSPTTSTTDIAPNLAKDVDVIRNLGSRSFEGERERERLGDGGGFLKSIWGTSLKDTKRGTDWALPFSVGEKVNGVGIAVTVEIGFLVTVAERFLVERFRIRTSESERLRACPRVDRW